MASHNKLRRLIEWETAQFNKGPTERHRISAILILLSAVALTMMMAAIKLASEGMSVWQILALRSFVSMLIILPLFHFAGISISVPSRQRPVYLWRILLALGAVSCWLYSITQLPLTVATALSFSKGFFAILLGVALLGERLSPAKVFIPLVGFVGALLILEPTGDFRLLGGIMGMLGALLAALLSMEIKRMSASEPTIRMMFYPLLGMTILFFVPALITWSPIETVGSVHILIITLSGILSQWLFICAYRIGELSALAPIEYSRLPFAMIAGILFFGEIPSLIMVLGITLIAASSYAALKVGSDRTPRS